MDIIDLSGLDEETAALIIQLQLEDSQALAEQHGGKGKAPEGSITDSQVAFRLYAKDLERSAFLTADRQMAKSIVRACQADADALETALAQEQAEAFDRRAACRLGGVAAPTDAGTSNAEPLDDEVLERLEALYVAHPIDDPEADGESIVTSTESQVGDNPESSTWAAGRSSRATHRHCIVCMEEVPFSESVRAPCLHEYCLGCLRELLEASLKDEHLFPPRCCKQPVTSTILKAVLPADLLHQYEEKKIEHEAQDRTYCSHATCSVFIKAENIADEKATCPICSRVTCTICKAEAHKGDCPKDTTLQEILSVARANGWQRCYRYRRLVELDHGCNHITYVPLIFLIDRIFFFRIRISANKLPLLNSCPCKSQFCYACGARWKCATAHSGRKPASSLAHMWSQQGNHAVVTPSYE